MVEPLTVNEVNSRSSRDWGVRKIKSLINNVLFDIYCFSFSLNYFK